MASISGALAKHWKETTNWLGFTLIGGLVPVWGGWVLFRLISKPVGFSDFSSNGEFAIYSSAMLAPSLYLILKDLKTSNFLYRHFFALVSIFGLALALILFAGVTAVKSGGIVTAKIDQPFLTKVTLLLFVGSVFVSYLVTALDNERIGIDIDEVRRVRDGQVKSLEKQFDDLGGHE